MSSLFIFICESRRKILELLNWTVFEAKVHGCFQCHSHSLPVLWLVLMGVSSVALPAWYMTDFHHWNTAYNEKKSRFPKSGEDKKAVSFLNVDKHDSVDVAVTTAFWCGHTNNPGTLVRRWNSLLLPLDEGSFTKMLFLW